MLRKSGFSGSQGMKVILTSQRQLATHFVSSHLFPSAALGRSWYQSWEEQSYKETDSKAEGQWLGLCLMRGIRWEVNRWGALA